MQEPINNPPVTPSPSVQPVQPDKPGLGSGEEAGPRPFSLPPQAPAGQPGAQAVPTEKPTPMEVAKETAQKQGWSQDSIQDHMKLLQQQLADAQTKLKDPSVAQKLTQDHFTALGKLTEKMNSDMKNVAKLTNQDFTPPKQGEGGLLEYVLKWAGSSQDMMKQALTFASSVKDNPNPGDMMKLQFAMNRATEKGELFSSIISSSVSGIKTIMSTQLG